MALVLNDRVKETTTTTGTGTINLAGAETGFETFVAGIGNSNTTYYCIVGKGTAEFEVGIGTVTDASPDTLSRTTILSSSNSDSAVNFSSGEKDVFCTLPASKTIREVDTALNTPTGTTAQRAGSPAAGDFRFNTTTSKFEGYSGSAWGDIGVGNFLVTNTFTGDGSDTTFTISNAVADENNLLVFIDGVFQAQNVYSISGTTLTFATAPANNRVITVYSALNNIQGANVVKATMTGDNSDTTLALGVTPISENAVQVYFDGVYQNKDSFSISGETLTFGVAPPTGVAVEAITLTVTDLAAAASSILVDEFTGDGSDTTFTLSAAPANENNTQVFVGGVYQEKATYSISGTTLTFSEAPANTVSIEVVSVAVGQINSAIQLSDADGDTKVMVEESADEDKIRFDTAGSERMVIDSTGVGIGQVPTRNLSIHAGDASSVFAHFTNTDTGTTSSDGAIIGLGASEDLVLNNFETGKNIIFENGGSERMRIDSAGHVGIGHTSPDFPLVVRDSTTSNYLKVIGATNGNAGIAFGDDDAELDGGILFKNDTKDLRFFKGGFTEAMRIDSSGSVGIGVSSIVREPLQVHRASTGDVQIHMTNSATGATASDGMTIFSNSTTSGFWQRESANMLFATAGSERMRIDSSGNLIVGTTTPINNSHTFVRNSGVPLNIKRTTDAGSQNSLFLGYGTGGNTANIQIRGDGNVRNTNGVFSSISSDRRTKENIANATGKLADLCKLSVKNFYYKDQPHEGKQIGFIADEMIDIFPSLVTEEDTREYDADGNVIKGYADQKGIKVGGIGFAILTKAIQELSAKVEELEGKIE